MISFVRGPVAQLSLAQAVIDVNGVGLGLSGHAGAHAAPHASSAPAARLHADRTAAGAAADRPGLWPGQPVAA